MNSRQQKSKGKLVLGIDPGNIMSGYALVDPFDYKPIAFGKIDNRQLIPRISVVLANNLRSLKLDRVVIERIKSYGMAVGQTVFDTCIEIGRFVEAFDREGIEVEYVGRKQYVVDLIGSPKATDAVVTQYLIDRFAPNTPNHGKGNKKEPGFFLGFSKDAWTAYAIAVWAIDKELGITWV